jgi:hypothetical protein
MEFATCLPTSSAPAQTSTNTMSPAPFTGSVPAAARITAAPITTTSIGAIKSCAKLDFGRVRLGFIFG